METTIEEALRLVKGEATALGRLTRVLPRYPTALAWNAYTLPDGSVHNRGGFGWDVRVPDWVFSRLQRDGLIEARDVTADVANPGDRPKYLKLSVTEKGRAALVVWETQNGLTDPGR